MKENNSINYSIIIPHKNIPKLLDRCLNSIPIRDDVQIIVVDDNSDPEKVDFTEFPGLDRPNTEVYFTKESKGAGFARNIGLGKAKGKWLIFADADDFFNECLNRLLDDYKDADADLIYFQTNSVDNNTLVEKNSRGVYYNYWIKKSVEKGEIENNIRYRIHPPWGKFFSHKLIKEHKIKFDEVITSNDVMFSTKTGHYAKKILLDLNFMYCSTFRQNSLEYTNTKVNISPRFYVALSQYRFLLSVSKAKYRINIWEFISQLKVLDSKKNIFYIKQCIKTMKLRHLIVDYFLFKLKYLLGIIKNQNAIS